MSGLGWVRACVCVYVADADSVPFFDFLLYRWSSSARRETFPVELVLRHSQVDTHSMHTRRTSMSFALPTWHFVCLFRTLWAASGPQRCSIVSISSWMRPIFLRFIYSSIWLLFVWWQMHVLTDIMRIYTWRDENVRDRFVRTNETHSSRRSPRSCVSGSRISLSSDLFANVSNRFMASESLGLFVACLPLVLRSSTASRSNEHTKCVWNGDWWSVCTVHGLVDVDPSVSLRTEFY